MSFRSFGQFGSRLFSFLGLGGLFRVGWSHGTRSQYNVRANGYGQQQQQRGRGWTGCRIPAACFSRILAAATSFALASSLPLMPWPFFCYMAKRPRLSEPGRPVMRARRFCGCGFPYRGGHLFLVGFASLVALVSAGHCFLFLVVFGLRGRGLGGRVLDCGSREGGQRGLAMDSCLFRF